MSIATLEAELAVTMEVAQPSSKVPVAGIADHVDGWGDFDVPMGGTAATSARITCMTWRLWEDL